MGWDANKSEQRICETRPTGQGTGTKGLPELHSNGPIEGPRSAILRFLKANPNCKATTVPNRGPGKAESTPIPSGFLHSTFDSSLRQVLARPIKWVWLKKKELGLRGFQSLVPFTRVPFWFRFFEPQPNESLKQCFEPLPMGVEQTGLLPHEGKLPFA